MNNILKFGKRKTRRHSKDAIRFASRIWAIRIILALKLANIMV